MVHKSPKPLKNTNFHHKKKQIADSIIHFLTRDLFIMNSDSVISHDPSKPPLISETYLKSRRSLDELAFRRSTTVKIQNKVTYFINSTLLCFI